MGGIDEKGEGKESLPNTNAYIILNGTERSMRVLWMCFVV
jgi:hypothetical protein